MSVYRFADYCICPNCRSGLIQTANSLKCLECEETFDIMNGIPRLLPRCKDDRDQRYLQNCERMAKENLQRPFETKKDYRHDVWLKFIGDLKGKRVLDIGSSQALYLDRINADFRVAFDLARTYLESISEEKGIIRVQGNAEYLPFKPGYFDVVLLSDILEHVLDAQKVADNIRLICTPVTRVFVHVPWEENLEQYMQLPYEFSHLRYFDAYKIGLLWRGFHIIKFKNTYPNLSYPFIFRLQGTIPLFLYNRLVDRYFLQPGVADKDYEWRHAKSLGLPVNERILLRLFKPTFRMFELKLINRGSSNAG